MLFPTCPPEEVGFSSQRLQRLTQTIQKSIDANLTTGVVTLLAKKGIIFHFQSQGVKNLKSKTPMQLDDIFRIYSMTKPIASVAAMMLYEEGLFQLFHPIEKYIPEMAGVEVMVKETNGKIQTTPCNEKPTIQHMLTHSGGLSGYGTPYPTIIDKLIHEQELLNPKKTLKNFIEKLGEIPLLFQPGTVWNYGVSTDVIAYLVETLSGMSFRDLLRKRIFNPLEMTDTDYRLKSTDFTRLTTFYHRNLQGKLTIGDEPETSSFKQEINFFGGGSGLLSTAEDYLQFAQMMLNKGQLADVTLLSPKTVDFMTQNHLVPELLPMRMYQNPIPGYGFGLGVKVMMDIAKAQKISSVGEFGWNGMAGTVFWVDPQEELIVILMQQILPPDGIYPLWDELYNLVYQARM